MASSSTKIISLPTYRYNLQPHPIRGVWLYFATRRTHLRTSRDSKRQVLERKRLSVLTTPPASRRNESYGSTGPAPRLMT